MVVVNGWVVLPSIGFVFGEAKFWSEIFSYIRLMGSRISLMFVKWKFYHTKSRWRLICEQSIFGILG
jgi:hypothetical protein